MIAAGASLLGSLSDTGQRGKRILGAGRWQGLDAAVRSLLRANRSCGWMRPVWGDQS
jgi:hypothetical protein